MSESGNGSNKKELKREPVHAGRWKTEEYVNTTHRVVLEQGTTRDEFTEPRFWSHLAVNFKPYDIIRVTEETGAYYAELLVTNCDRLYACVEVLNFKDLNPQADAKVAESAASITAEWKGPTLKWCAIRKADNARVKDGMSKAEALTFCAEYEAQGH